MTAAWAPKMSTLMAASETLFTDPAFQAFWGVAVDSAGAPARMISQSIGTFLPI